MTPRDNGNSPGCGRTSTAQIASKRGATAPRLPQHLLCRQVTFGAGAIYRGGNLGQLIKKGGVVVIGAGGN